MNEKNASYTMKPRYKIRAAKAEDIETIFNFICKLEDTIFDSQGFAGRYKTNLQNSDVIYLVSVDEEGRVMGFIGCRGMNVLHHEGLVFEIQKMYVAENWRGQGVGQALFAALEKKAI